MISNGMAVAGFDLVQWEGSWMWVHDASGLSDAVEYDTEELARLAAYNAWGPSAEVRSTDEHYAYIKGAGEWYSVVGQSMDGSRILIRTDEGKDYGKNTLWFPRGMLAFA